MTVERALSLGQLSASAIAYGAKRIETRTWPAPDWVVGQRIAIHCSKTLPAGGLYGLKLWMQEEVNHQWLVEEGLMEAGSWQAKPEDLPRGAFVATAVVASCSPTVDLIDIVSDLEYSHGDYRKGRFGWMLMQTERLVCPIPADGSLQLWKLTDHQRDLLEVAAVVETKGKGHWHTVSGTRPRARTF